MPSSPTVSTWKLHVPQSTCPPQLSIAMPQSAPTAAHRSAPHGIVASGETPPSVPPALPPQAATPSRNAAARIVPILTRLLHQVAERLDLAQLEAAEGAADPRRQRDGKHLDRRPGRQPGRQGVVDRVQRTLH